MQHQTNTLQPTKIGIVTPAVRLGLGINEAQICKPLAVTPTDETKAKTPSWQATASAKSTLPLAALAAPVVAPFTLVVYVKVLSAPVGRLIALPLIAINL